MSKPHRYPAKLTVRAKADQLNFLDEVAEVAKCDRSDVLRSCIVHYQRTIDETAEERGCTREELLCELYDDFRRIRDAEA